MPKKQKAKIKQKNKCPEKLIRTEAAKEIAEIDRSLQDQKYQLRCRAAIDLLTAKLNMINADLSRKKRHVVINQISSRVKTAESIYTKLIRKGLEPDFDTARAELKDLIGIRVVCPFEDEVYEVADRIGPGCHLACFILHLKITKSEKSGKIRCPGGHPDMFPEFRITVYYNLPCGKNPCLPAFFQ